MASKGIKTKHVIQTIDSSRSANYPETAVIPEGWEKVCRPCLPHEIKLKHLSEEEIADGTWTLKQMFDYLEYMQDFCSMPNNEPSIYIAEEAWSHILSNIKGQKFGLVEKIDVVPKCEKSLYNSVFVHIKEWNTYYMDPPGTEYADHSTIEMEINKFITNNENAIRTRFALITGKKIKLYYDKHDKSSFVEIEALRLEHLQ